MKELTSDLQVGAVVDVRIKQLLPFGLLVETTHDQKGIIRERELSWEKKGQFSWRDVYKPNQTLQAVLLNRVDDEYVEFSLRLVEHDPWQKVAQTYQVDQLVEGVVTGLQSYGVFVEIEPGISGLLQTGQMPSWVRGRGAEVFWPGDRVWVVIEEIEVARRRLLLSLTKAWERRWQKRGEETAVSAHLPQKNNPPLTLKSEFVEQPFFPRPMTIGVVEDETVHRQAICHWFQQIGHSACGFETAESLLDCLQQERFDLVLADLGLPGMDGLQAVTTIQQNYPQVRCVIMTDWASASANLTRLEPLRAKGVSLLIKPLLPEDLFCLLTPQKELKEEASPIILLDEPSPLMLKLNQSHQVTVQRFVTRLCQQTGASKVVLFALDGAQRRVTAVSESGQVKLNKEAFVDLIYSPVQDVAEEQIRVNLPDSLKSDGYVRYLKPLLSFRSCLGIPVIGDYALHYALFFFHPNPSFFTATHEEIARMGAITISALLEQHQLQTHTMELQRLALLGSLTQGLVHEMNHRLSPIGFALNELQERCQSLNESLGKSPENIQIEVQQAGQMLNYLAENIRNLVKTSRLFGHITVQGQAQLLRLDEVIEEAVSMVRDTANRAHVTITVHPPPHLIVTRAQVAQLQQVLLNIMLNAIQQINSLRPQIGGNLHIFVKTRQKRQETLFQITIEDDGPGIHRRLWERIFDLGFTAGREDGSGLGLYITRSLIHAMGGRVSIASSHILWGTTFMVELPVRI